MTTKNVLVSVGIIAGAIVLASVSKNLSVFLAIVLGGMVLAGYTVIAKQKAIGPGTQNVSGK